MRRAPPSLLAPRLRVALVLALVAAAPGPARAQPVVKLAAPAPLKLCDNGQSEDPAFPLDLASPLTLDQIEHARTVLVTRDGLVDTSALGQAFIPRVEPSPGRGPTLLVKVDFSRVDRPGIYRVSVELQVKGATPQTVIAELVHPGAAVEVRHAPLQLHLTGLRGQGELVPPTLEVAVTSDCSPVKGLSILASSPQADDRGRLGGSLRVAGRDVAHRAEVQLPIEIATPFPAGTSQGTLRLRGPQMKEDVVVAYTVKRRLPDLLIFPLWLAGCLIGWLIRFMLKKRLDRLEIDVRADQALARVEARRPSLLALAALRKGTIHAAIVALDAAAQDVVDRRMREDGAGLEEAIARLERALKALSDTRDKVREEALSRVAETIAATLLSASLPPGVDRAAEGLRQLLEDEERLWFQDLMAEAQTRHREAERAFHDTLVPAARAWVDRASRALDALGDDSTPVPRSMASLVKELDPIAALPAVDPGAGLDPSKLGPFVRALQEIHRRTADQATTLSGALRREVERCIQALVAAGEGGEDTLRAALRELDKAGGEDAATRLEALAASMPLFREAVSGVAERLTGGAADMPSAVADLLRARDYPAAIAQAAKKETGPTPIADEDEAGPASEERLKMLEAPVGAPAPGAASPLAAAPAPGAAAAPVPLPSFRSAGALLGQRAANARGDLRWYRGIALVVAATGGAVVAFFSHADAFVGTRQELFTLFALGFGSELTLEAMIQLVLGKRQ
jgi:hypothetical protein